MRCKLPAVHAALAFVTTVGATAPALANSHRHPDQHSIDVHLHHQLKGPPNKRRGSRHRHPHRRRGSRRPGRAYTLGSSTCKVGNFGDTCEVLVTCGTGYYDDYNPNTKVDPAWGGTGSTSTSTGLRTSSVRPRVAHRPGVRSARASLVCLPSGASARAVQRQSLRLQQRLVQLVLRPAARPLHLRLCWRAVDHRHRLADQIAAIAGAEHHEQLGLGGCRA
jgi:hypothetical protein